MLKDVKCLIIFLKFYSVLKYIFSHLIFLLPNCIVLLDLFYNKFQNINFIPYIIWFDNQPIKL